MALSTTPAPQATAVRVFLNLSPGRLTVTEVLEALVASIPIEHAALMDPEDDQDPRPPAHAEVVRLLPHATPVQHIRRHESPRGDRHLCSCPRHGDGRYAAVCQRVDHDRGRSAGIPGRQRAHRRYRARRLRPGRRTLERLPLDLCVTRPFRQSIPRPLDDGRFDKMLVEVVNELDHALRRSPPIAMASNAAR